MDEESSVQLLLKPDNKKTGNRTIGNKPFNFILLN